MTRHHNRAHYGVQDRSRQKSLTHCGDPAQRDLNFVNKIK
jgi:hypothetical protein